MNKQKKKKMLTTTILLFVLLVAVIPLQSIGETLPWGPYINYIPSGKPVAKRHLRAVWISTVLNLDWPSEETSLLEDQTERIQKSKEELIVLLDKAVEMNMNAVFFQVSPEGDAIYESNTVPWSRYLTGTFGQDPGFDPLAFFIEEGHKRNLEIHAWFNPYRVSMSTSSRIKSTLNIDKSIYKEQSELIRTARSRYVVDPGEPASRQWVVDRVMEVVDNYDVDGIHFDDYFYSERYTGELKDLNTFNKYNNNQFSNIGDWRRNNTYELIKQVSNTIRNAKPWVKFGVSPAGVWGNIKDGHLDGSNTTTWYTNYDVEFADTKKWVEEELVDYIAPQIYYTFATSSASYGEVATWWADVCEDKNVHLYIGQALYKINDSYDSYFCGSNAVPEFTRQYKLNVTNPEISGSVLFRINNFYDEKKQEPISILKRTLWSTKSLVPEMPWKGGEAPEPLTTGRLEKTSYGNKIIWKNNDPNAAYYAIYIFGKGEKIDISSDKAAQRLIGTVRKTEEEYQHFVDTKRKSPTNLIYVVTSLDRLHNESQGLEIIEKKSKYFTDVGSNYFWALEAIDRLYKIDVVHGVGNDMFLPGNKTKRGDFILMLVNAFDLQAEFTDNFADVKKGDYYYEAIGVAKQLGIATGVNHITFNPEAEITREDMMVLVNRALEIADIAPEPDIKTLSKYSDLNDISDYALDSVSSLTKAEIINGSGSYIKPKENATRAEIAVVIDRVLDYDN